MNVSPLEPRYLLATTLHSGIVKNGTISSSSQADVYTIDVSAGAPFLVAVHDTSNSGFSPRLVVTKPNGGTALDNTSSNGISSIITTGSTGTYTVSVSAGAGTGTYSLIAYRPSADLDDADVVAGVSGRRFAKQMDPGDVDFFTLDATTGQALSAVVAENTPDLTLDPRAALIRPDGTIVANVADEHGVRVEDRAVQNGRYFVVVTDDGDNDSGIYGIAMTQLPGAQYTGDPDTDPLASGVHRAGDLPAGDQDVIQIPNAKVGDTITAAMLNTSGTMRPDMALYDPNGAFVVRGTRSNNNLTSSITAQATIAGTYWIVERDYTAQFGGTYDFHYDLTPASDPNPIVDGVLRIDGTANADKIIVSSTDTTLSVTLNGALSTYEIADFEQFQIYSGDGNDNIDMTGSDVSAYISAGSGDDLVHGGSGGDSITGGAGRNKLYGGEGNDRLNGSGGHDFLYGEGGDDRLYGQDGDDNLDGGGGKDRLYGGNGNDFLEGGSSNDRLYGEAGNDTLQGGKNNDLLDGGDDSDTALNKDDGDTLVSIEVIA